MLREHILLLLHETPLFKDLAAEKLVELAELFTSKNVNSGETIIEEGELGDGLFLVASGRFRVIHREENQETILGEVGRGELIGELSLLTQQPRAASVVAIRDSVLLKLSKEAFSTFIRSNPLQLMPITKSAIIRLVSRTPVVRRTVSTIAVLAAGKPTVLYKEVAQALSNELAKFGTVMHLNLRKVHDFISQYPGGNNSNLDEDNQELITTWLSQLEARYDYIVYEGDSNYSNWAQRCIRESDRVVLVGDAKQNVQLNDVEKGFFSETARLRKKTHLVLLHDPSAVFPTHTNEWLNIRPDIPYHHMRRNSTTDIRRIARLITERSIGLVLGGGGARGLAHIGVYKALQELGVAIDWVGGSSSGAGIAGFCAMGYASDIIAKQFTRYFLKNKRRIMDYTVPILALTKGMGLAKNLKAAYNEDLYVEDLWKNFFCIASNLTQSRIEIIQRGLLWKAVRASLSLPAVLPPISDAREDLLVDGGVMNNLPVDVMRNLLGSGKIIAVRIMPNREMRGNVPEGSASGWSLLSQLLNKRHRDENTTILEVISKSIELSSEDRSKEMAEQADCCIEVTAPGVKLLNVEAIDDLIEVGYRATMEKADNLRGTLL